VTQWLPNDFVWGLSLARQDSFLFFKKGRSRAGDVLCYRVIAAVERVLWG